MTQIPQVSRTVKGVLFFIAGLILFLYVTNIITLGLQMVLLLASIIIMIYGFVEMDAWHKVMKLINKK